MMDSLFETRRGVCDKSMFLFALVSFFLDRDLSMRRSLAVFQFFQEC